MTQATDQARLTQLAASTGPVECLVPNAGIAPLADGLDLTPKKTAQPCGSERARDSGSPADIDAG
ncbi:hypothetical protein HGO40_15160 [Pseudomonas sp. CG7]|nr:hypothetical protein [Pseudomonas sp. CG7]